MMQSMGRLSGWRRACTWMLVSTVMVSLLHGGDVEAQRKNNRKKPAAKKPAEPEIEVTNRRKNIGKVDLATRSRALAAAAKVDQLVEQNYRKYKITPNAMTSDEEFLRRVYLDVVGRIPTYEEAKRFLAQQSPEKRERLIDTLLNDEGYSSHMYNYMADLLRLVERPNNNVTGEPYLEWVKVSMEENKPWDEFVNEMITAEGKMWENPATGYIMRDAGMPLDATNNTVRVFLGTQIGCAQCHDHPFDRWTQKEFYQTAAYMFGTQTRLPGGGKMYGGIRNIVNHMRDELRKVNPDYNGGGQYNRLLIGNLFAVYDQPERRLRLPHDYQYDDAKPKDLVDAKTLFGPPAYVAKGANPRVEFANWMTSRDNPRFARTIANRMWKKLMGIGQIEPVDDMRDDTVAENPELMDHLEAEMKRVDFNLKDYLRILLNTKTYQRKANAEEVAMGQLYHFPGPVLRRMSAEQAWDSFITLSVHEPENYQRRPVEDILELVNVDLTKATAEEIHEKWEKLREADSYKMKKPRQKPFEYKRMLLVRASELPQPAPQGHFLREFGQSDRETIEGSSTEGSVPQVLQMFNGPVTHMVLEKDSLLVHTVLEQRSVDEGIDAIFLSILSRYPTSEERQVATGEVTKEGAAGYGNVVWALVNTREFLFIR